MRKNIVIAIVAVCLLALSAIQKADAMNKEPRYSKLHLPSVIMVDPETGVQYIVIDEFGINGGVGITPRLDANGNVMVSGVK